MIEARADSVGTGGRPKLPSRPPRPFRPGELRADDMAVDRSPGSSPVVVVVVGGSRKDESPAEKGELLKSCGWSWPTGGEL